MNCQEYKEKIWTYSELSEDEKLYIDLHVQNCNDCKKVWAEVQYLSQSISQAKGFKPFLENSAAFTHKVMAALPSNKQSHLEKVGDMLLSPWLQNSLRIASVLLIVTLIFENVDDPKHFTKFFPEKNTVILNSSAFLKKYQELSKPSSQTISYYSQYQKVKRQKFKS